MAAGDVPPVVRDMQAAIDGMRIVMSIHAQWMLGIVSKITDEARSRIPKDYEAAIASHQEHIIRKMINKNILDQVCDFVGLESTFLECLSLLLEASLLDEECQELSLIHI